MSFTPHLLFSLAGGLLLLSGCQRDLNDIEVATEVKIPLYLTVPKGDPATRALGDPGTYETFKKPAFLFLFVLNDAGTAYQTLQGVGAIGATTVRPIPLNPANWKEDGDFYRYDYDPATPNIDPYIVPLTSGFQPHHVYVAASSDEFALTLPAAGTLEERIRNATFDLGTGADHLEESELQHLYSSPARLHATFTTTASGRKLFDIKDFRNSPATIGGKEYRYYGTVFDADTHTPYLDIVLYHVAAKVDLLWNVQQSDRADVRLTQMNIGALRRTRGKVFLPMDNVKSDAGADHTGTHVFPLTVGDQWNGRHYFYALPYAVAETNRVFPLSLTYDYKQKNDAVGTKSVASLDIPFYLGTATPTLSADKQGVYVPWVRYNVAVKK